MIGRREFIRTTTAAAAATFARKFSSTALAQSASAARVEILLEKPSERFPPISTGTSPRTSAA